MNVRRTRYAALAVAAGCIVAASSARAADDPAVSACEAVLQTAQPSQAYMRIEAGVDGDGVRISFEAPDRLGMSARREARCEFKLRDTGQFEIVRLSVDGNPVPPYLLIDALSREAGSYGRVPAGETTLAK